MKQMIFRAIGTSLALVAAAVFAAPVFAAGESKTGEGSQLHDPQSSTTSFGAPSPESVTLPTVSPSGASFMTDIIDGDKMLLSTGEWVQLIGVDASDSIAPEPSKEATAFIKKIRDRKRTRKKPRLEYYVEAKDRYNRTPAYVYRVSDELLLIAETAKQGEGRAYAVFPLKHMGELKKYDQAEGDKHLWLYKITPKNAENEKMIADIQGLTEDQKKSVRKYIDELKHPDPGNGKGNDVSDERSQEILYAGLSPKTSEDLQREEDEKERKKAAEAKAQAKKAAEAKLAKILQQLTAAQQAIFKEVKMYEEAGEPCIDISYMQNSYKESQGGDAIRDAEARASFRKELEIIKRKGFLIEKPNKNGTTCLESPR